MTGTWTLPAPTPAPAPTDTRPTGDTGTSLNQANHREGTYTLTRTGNTVSATFSSSASPVQYYARADQGRAAVFRIAATALRPAQKVTLTGTGKEVNRDGTPKTNGMSPSFKMEVHPNGEVYYVDEGVRAIGFLKYSVTGTWTLPAADDDTETETPSVPPPETPQLSLKATTTAGLNVRSGPGTGHSKVGFITGGSTTRYDILGKDAATPVWWQIQYSSSVKGWVHGNYVQTHGDLSGVPVR